MNQENKQLPTAESILQLYLTEHQLDETSIFTLRNAIKAIEEHTRLHTKHLQARISELESINTALLHQRDFYRNKLNEAKGVHIAKDLGVDENTEMAPIVQALVIDEIKDLKAENERLKKANSRLAQRVYEENDNYCKSLDQVNRLCEMMLRAQDQNQKLMEALEWYADSSNYIHSETEINKCFVFKMEKKAKEALKGSSDE